MNLIVCEIVNDTLSPIKIIDDAISVIWVQRYNEAGEFEAYLRASAENLQLFSVERYIIREDTESVMISEKVVLTTDAENGNYMTVTGRSAESLLSRRVTTRLYNYQNTNVENIVRALILTNIGSQTGAARRIPLISLGTAAGFTNTVEHMQILGGTIYDAITEIAKNQNWGVKVTLDRSARNLVFNLYTGTDRTFSQIDRPAVVFSPDYDDLCSSEYETDRTDAATVAYVAGEEVNGARPIIEVNPNTSTGINRREVYLEADANTQKGTMTDAEYQSVLTQRGVDSLAQRREAVNFSGEVLYHSQFVFGRDYFIGDKVQISNGYGIEGAAYVTEMTEVDDENGYIIRPTLSQWVVN